MKTLKSDILKPAPSVNAVCVTTNLRCRNNGTAIMGAGIALAAHKQWNLDIIYGSQLRRGQKSVGIIKEIDLLSIVAFPTKDNWRNPSSIELIKKGLAQLVELTSHHGWQKVWVPSLGTNNGGLSTSVVWPIMEQYLDERFTLVLR